MEKIREAGALMEMEEERVRVAFSRGVVGVSRPLGGGQGVEEVIVSGLWAEDSRV
jgi:hypothetical protein